MISICTLKKRYCVKIEITRKTVNFLSINRILIANTENEKQNTETGEVDILNPNSGKTIIIIIIVIKDGLVCLSEL